jgi:hypothetical protein
MTRCVSRSVVVGNTRSLVVTVAAMLCGAIASCSSTDDGNTAGSGATGSGATGGSGAGGTGASGGGIALDGGGGSGGNPDCPHAPDADEDGDGFTVAGGDCNDCDENANPGAVEVIGAASGAKVDEDCDGQADEVEACDTGLALTDTSAASGAKAIDLCRVTTAAEPGWGVLEARYVKAWGGPAVDPKLQAGLFDGFGPNVNVQKGERMLALSSGRARIPGQPDACPGNKCSESGMGAAPAFFPQNVPNCKLSTVINDDIALELTLRAPTNATGYSFDFKFNSFEFPYFVCSSYNDQFVALVNPPPDGSIFGNISFDANANPVSVNIAYFDVCDPADVGEFAGWCKMTSTGCPSPPNPYCPSGNSQLLGTGFDTLGGGLAGATSWLKSTAPVTGGQEFSIRFAIWDTGDWNLDSTVLVDNFQWIAEAGTVPVGTTKVELPK